LIDENSRSTETDQQYRPSQPPTTPPEILMTRRSPLWRAFPSEFSPRLYFGTLLVLLLATILAPAHVQAQAAVSVKAPLNGDRIVPGTPFVISASATGDATVGPVTGVEFFIVPNKGAAGPVELPGADPVTTFAPLGSRITFVQITNAGSGYVTEPNVTISDGVVVFNTKAAINAAGEVVSVRLNEPGNSGFDPNNEITVDIDRATDPDTGLPTGVQATGEAGFSIGVGDIPLGAPGYDEFFPPVVTVSAPDLPGGTQAVAEPDIVGGILNLAIVNRGSGYTSPPTITVAAPRAAFSVGSVALNPFVLSPVTLPGNDRYTLYAVASYLLGPDIESGGGTDGPVVIGEQGVVPTVTITAPTDTTGFLAGQSILVQAEAEFVPPTPEEGDAVAVFELFVNGASAGTSATPVFNYVPATAGFYALVVRATTIRGLVADSSPRTLTVTQGKPPTIVIEAPVESPAPGAPLPEAYEMRLNETVTIRAAVEVLEDGTNVERVEFLLNGRIVASLPGSASYNFSWTADNAGRYLVSARVIDNLGNVVETGQILINVTQGEAPTVEIVTPADTDILTPGIPVTILAEAEGKSGSVTQVEFFVNGVSVGAASPPDAPPYFATFTPSAVGSYTLLARVTDSLGNVADSDEVTVDAEEPAGPQPLVSLTQPTGATQLVGGSRLYVNATATKADGTIDPDMTVEFFVNGLRFPGAVGELKPGSFSTTFNVSRAPFSYVVQAVATQGDGTKGASSTVSISSAVAQNQLPQVQMVDLLPGTNPASKGGVVPLRARASFPATAATNARVEFYANGVYLGEQATAVNGIYTFNWTVPSALEDAAVRITARAIAENFTGGGAAFSGSVLTTNLITLNLEAGVPPAPEITFPSTTGNIPVGIATEIRATVPDLPSGSIANVDFYANGVLVGSDATAPYAVAWTPTSAGIYTLAAVATSTAGLEGTSAAGYTVSVTLGAAPTSILTTAGSAAATARVAGGGSGRHQSAGCWRRLRWISSGASGRRRGHGGDSPGDGFRRAGHGDHCNQWWSGLHLGATGGHRPTDGGAQRECDFAGYGVRYRWLGGAGGVLGQRPGGGDQPDGGLSPHVLPARSRQL